MNPNNLIATKITDRSFVTIGDIINYTILLQNSGTVPDTAIILTDLVPQGANFIDGSILLNNSSLPLDNPALGIDIPDMAVGSINTVTFQARVVGTPIGNIMQNIGQVDYEFLVGASIVSASIDTNTVTTVENTAVLALTKVAPQTSSVGQGITFTVTVRNVGNTTATGIRFIDTIPTGTTFVSNSVTIQGTSFPGLDPSPPTGFGPLSLPPNTFFTIAFSVNVVSTPPGNIINNVADSTYNFIIDPVTIRNGSARSSSNVTTTTLVSTTLPFADLSGITKFVDKKFAQCGDILTYTVTVPNSGTTTATSVIVSDTLSNGLTFVPGTLFVNCIPSGNPLNNINVGTISPGGISTVTFKAQVNC